MITVASGDYPLTNFCVNAGAPCASVLLTVDSTEIYTVSYTYTSSVRNSLVLSKTCLLDRVTQNQVVATSCWFESGQGHQSDQLFDEKFRERQIGIADHPWRPWPSDRRGIRDKPERSVRFRTYVHSGPSRQRRKRPCEPSTIPRAMRGRRFPHACVRSSPRR
jgi:hypothetical protein